MNSWSRDTERLAAHPPEKSTRRRRLWQLCGLMGFLLVAMFAYVIFSGIGSPRTGENPSRLHDGITDGGSALRRYDMNPVWIVRYSETDVMVHDSLGGAVEAGGSSLCPILPGEFCYFDARSTVSGLIIRYVENRPAQISRDIPWYGGFVDPANGAVYDRFGRGYRINPGVAPPHLKLVTGLDSPVSP